jgi:hypothetical protein
MRKDARRKRPAALRKLKAEDDRQPVISECIVGGSDIFCKFNHLRISGCEI